MLIAISLCALAAAAYIPAASLATAVRLLFVVRQVASGTAGNDPRVVVREISGRAGSQGLQAIAYRPATAHARSAVILIPGVSELGNRHPRLVELASALAGAGFLVVTPDIRMFREFRIHPPPLDEISFWIQEVPRLEGSGEIRRVGLAGISFAGTLSLIAAAQPRNQDAVAFVLGIGCFDDLLRCSRDWFAAGPVTVSPGYYPTRYYARWILMLAAIDLLQAETDRMVMQEVLRSLLLQKDVPPPDAMTSEGRRWHRLATMREDESDPPLADQIESHVAPLVHPGLSTAEPAAKVLCPVFLAHGAFDDLIPPEESRRLKMKILNAKSYLLVSPFLTHTHPHEKPLSLVEKARAILDVSVFFYHLAGVL